MFLLTKLKTRRQCTCTFYILCTCSPLEAFTAPQRLLAYTYAYNALSFPYCASSRHCLMQSSSLNANQTQCIERIRIDTCAHDAMLDGQGHHRNVCVWTSRLSGPHYRPETATLPEICRLLLAKLWLRSN